MLYNNYKLDRFQEEAVASIDTHHTVIVAAPTGQSWIIPRFERSWNSA